MTMNHHGLVLMGALAVVAVASVPMAGQAPAAGSPAAQTRTWTAPRTPWGDPDLQGLWRGLTRVPLERPSNFEGREFLTDAEVAAKVREGEERNRHMLEGTSERRGQRSFPLYDAIFGYSEDPVRISRRTSAVIDPPDGRIPSWTLEQVKRWEAREAATRGRGEADSWEDRQLAERCISTVHVASRGNYGMGGPRAGLVEATDVRISGAGVAVQDASGGPVRRILQAPGYVALVMEEDGEYHMIPVDGRPSLGPKIRQWSGEARGHWEGDTLVVETTNVNDKQDGGLIVPSASGGAYPGSGETLRVTERYTLVHADTLEYRYTIDDPAVYVRPYTVLHELSRDNNYAIAPHMCHENNKSIGAIFASARADESGALKSAVEAAADRQRRLEQLREAALKEAANKR